MKCINGTNVRGTLIYIFKVWVCLLSKALESGGELVIPLVSDILYSLRIFFWVKASLLTNNHLQDSSILMLSNVCGYLVVGASRLMWKSIPLLLF